MYTIARMYGVHSILPQCASKFGIAASALRALNKQRAINYINTIYELPGLDETDELRIEAWKQASMIADSITMDISLALAQKQVQSEILRVMPKAGPELFAMGYKPRSPTVISRTRDSCGRCLGTLRTDTERAFRSCTACSETPTQSITIEVPAVCSTGLNICLWQCQGCTSIWQGEAPRTKLLVLKKCQMCVPPGKKKKKGAGKKRTEWTCGGCRTVWKYLGVLQNEDVDMDVCLCCA
jgi:hypothetical protein